MGDGEGKSLRLSLLTRAGLFSAFKAMETCGKSETVSEEYPWWGLIQPPVPALKQGELQLS